MTAKANPPRRLSLLAMAAIAAVIVVGGIALFGPSLTTKPSPSGPVASGPPEAVADRVPFLPDDVIADDDLRHDSRDDRYRTPYGAVPAGTAVTLRLRAAAGDLTEATVRVWDLGEGPLAPADVEIRRWFRRDAPDFWEIAGRGSRHWTYDPNSARIWASLVAGADFVEPTPDALVMERAFLPLAFARFLTTVTGLRPGPSPKHQGQYRYPIHTPAAGRWAVRQVSELLRVPDDSLLVDS